MNLEVIVSPELAAFGAPEFKTAGAAAIDLRAMLNSPLSETRSFPHISGDEGKVDRVLLHSGQQIKIDSGLKIHIKSRNHVGLMFPRSSMGAKGLVLANGTGVIDSDYQGPLIMVLWNRSNDSIVIENGERVAQYMLTTAFQFDMTFVDEFSTETERGEGGFGSTGSV